MPLYLNEWSFPQNDAVNNYLVDPYYELHDEEISY